VLETLRVYPKNAEPMHVLQASVPMVAMSDPWLFDDTREGNVRKAIRLIGLIPPLAAAWHRIRSGSEPLPPDPSLSHAANFLYQLTGKKPDPEVACDFDACLILHADHSFNASTFTSRGVASTKADIYAGVAAAMGTLSGGLHGGANERVMRMLLQAASEVDSEDDVAQWIRKHLERGEKVMGMGHAVYKIMDPRARILKELSKRLAYETGNEKWYRLLTRIEAESLEEFKRREKFDINTNVDFYSGLSYMMIGIPMDLLTVVFSIARVAGWCAHIIEEKFAEAQDKPALYRPKADYIGPGLKLIMRNTGRVRPRRQIAKRARTADLNLDFTVNAFLEHRVLYA